MESYGQTIEKVQVFQNLTPSPYICRCWAPKRKVTGSDCLLKADKTDVCLQNRDTAWMTMSRVCTPKIRIPHSKP